MAKAATRAPLAEASDHAVPALVERIGELTQFDPGQTKAKVRQLDAVIREAAELRDWEAMNAAAKYQVNEQTEFVMWWKETVSKAQSSGANQWLVPDRGPTNLTPAEQAHEDTGISKQKVERWNKALGDPEAYEKKIIDAARKAAGWVDDEDELKPGSDEAITPPEWIERARATMDGIDLDPASNEVAQTYVRAERYFSADDDGLSQTWESDSLWLSPPYSQNKIELFAQKLLEELSAGRVTQAIVLVSASTSAKWFQSLFSASTVVFLPNSRIKFLESSGEVSKTQPAVAQVFMYFGENWKRFAAEFNDLGLFAMTVDSVDAVDSGDNSVA